jgi:DNA topoisomerase-1
MKKALIIVESPTKIKTLRKFLGSNYSFESSLGHIRDLPAKKFGIDVDNDFEPQYEVLDGKKDVIERLKKAAKEAEIVYLSPDPDREGEAIAWHIAEILPKNTRYKRVTFNAITKEAVKEALDNPRDIDQALVDAQQARRLLDRIVGYKISPILHRKIQKGRDGFLSAGRVQSAALKLVVDREKEIEAFKPVEYWTLEVDLESPKEKKSFKANLFAVDGKKVEKEPVDGKDVFLIPNEATAKKLEAALKNARYEVTDIEKKEKKRNPYPPFITSTLQQEASRHFGFSASRTMSIAQSLYEGVELKGGSIEGLITYMRTDSVRISPEGIKEVRSYIKKTYGDEFLPSEPNFYGSKKSAQDAHEAIRPTNLELNPESIKGFLTTDQFKLYQLIWRRFVSSQVKPAIYDTVTVDILADKNLQLRSTGSQIKFQGFLILYEEKIDLESDAAKESTGTLLPDLSVKDVCKLLAAHSDQSFTRPPARFTEASLIKELEKSGIGRPSTYATIMNKIQSKEYTVKEKSALKPTELGRVICAMLEENFKQIMDIRFTAEMEEELDKIAEENKDWKKFIKHFWKDFIPSVEVAEKEAFVPRQETAKPCPRCGHNLQKVWSRNKYFYGCSNYPICDYTAPLEELEINKEEYSESFDWDQKCPKCSSDMKVRSGKFGLFLGCIRYPECKGIVNIPRKGEVAADDLPDCPAMGCPGKLTARRSRFGKVFYSCSTYPDCDVIGNSVDQIIEKYSNTPRQKAEVKKPLKQKKGAAVKEKKTEKPTKQKKAPSKGYKVSKELEDIIEVKSASRPDITKKVWDYIKKNDLQDKKNKRLIVPDKKLEKIFKQKEPIDMMQLARYLSDHILGKDA